MTCYDIVREQLLEKLEDLCKITVNSNATNAQP